jgi:hypothetical protein
MALLAIISPKCAVKDPKCVWAAPDTIFEWANKQTGKERSRQ